MTHLIERLETVDCFEMIAAVKNESKGDSIAGIPYKADQTAESSSTDLKKSVFELFSSDRWQRR